ncbi:ABC transporter substrate-binding protein [Paenibacillus bouchesdurhonensis]|uniref:ABC transporter substrate-binding protein n=1 Tax=Paenibacillus bouchesdurhonensis TaxID=1870990 RepID=UPI000DA628F6|nr:extracellular solute-binding protein [Paenibacillus bouchesdurhonensis]
MKLGKVSVIALLVVVVLAGCSLNNNKDQIQSEGSDNGKKTVVEIFNPKAETKAQMEALIEQFESENKNIDIVLTTVGAGQNGMSALAAKFASKEEPALFILPGRAIAVNYKDYLLDVSDMESAKQAIDGTLQGAMIDGAPYGIPLNIEGFGWMINKEIFQAAGVDPETVTTYDKFVEAVKKIDSQKESLGLNAVFAFVGDDGGFASQYSNHFTAPEFDNDLNVTYEADQLNWKYGDRMKEYTDLINQYNVQPIVSLDYSTAVEELFANNKVAILSQGNWIVPTLDSIDPTFSKEKLGILPFFVDSDSEGYISAGPSWFWFVNKQKDEQTVEASKKFLDWMYTSDFGKEQILSSFKYIPAHKGYNIEGIEDPVSKEIYQMLEAGKTRVWVFNQYPDGFYSNMHGEFQKYLAGNITWDQFIEITKNDFTKLSSR